MVSTHGYIPHTGTVEEERAILSNLLDIADIPYIETMIIVYHTQLQRKKKGDTKASPGTLSFHSNAAKFCLLWSPYCCY